MSCLMTPTSHSFSNRFTLDSALPVSGPLDGFAAAVFDDEEEVAAFLVVVLAAVLEAVVSFFAAEVGVAMGIVSAGVMAGVETGNASLELEGVVSIVAEDD